MTSDALGSWYDLVRKLGKGPDLRHLDSDDAWDAYMHSQDVHGDIARVFVGVGDRLASAAAEMGGGRAPAASRSSPLQETDVLVGAAKSGSDAAWRRILEKYHTMLEAHVRCRIPGLARRRFDVDDALHGVIRSAWQGIHAYEYRGEGSFRRWLASLAVNAVRSELRGRSQGGPTEIPPWSGSERAEESAAMLEAIGRLDDLDRDILIQRHFEDLSFDEIARNQACPREHARALYAQALVRLQRVLGE